MAQRLIIYTKDVIRITGKSERSSRRLLMRIREKYGRKKHQKVTLAEFCEDMGMRMEDVLPHLGP
jgi:hypothetical protein